MTTNLKRNREGQDKTLAAARGVIQRLLGGRGDGINLESIAGMEGRDVYEYEAKNGKLIVRGSSGIAIAHGFYDYLRSSGLGMVGWAGTRLDIPKRWPDAPLKRVETPYKFRFYFNVVTYGYTLPYWNWQRWEQELDWMALHGINMPLALVATEAIGERVWKKLGLTQKEIEEFDVGPAYQPWHRMGNINKHNGPLSASWHADQVALQHKVLARMRELGMDPIVPGFAGFVPKGLARIHPEITLHEMNWGGFQADCNTFLLAPGNSMFTELGKLHIQEWEKEFGKFTYYLADCFNEMRVPETGRPMPELLADLGESIYKSVVAGNPDAVWVTQGWMLFDQKTWTPANLQGLLSRVPDDRMLILDEACDYNVFYKHPFHWDTFSGFYNKQWIYGDIPNMGGKTAYTGLLHQYAKGAADALKSPNRGRLVGCGFAPEGIENNEVIYELLSDMCWRSEAIDLDTWVQEYCINRYGGYPAEMKRAWDLLRKSCYGTFTDHPQISWQRRGKLTGTVNQDPVFFEAVETFLSCPAELRESQLYCADAIEMAAIYLGLKAEIDFRVVREGLEKSGNSPELDKVTEHGLQLLTDMDRLLESHPNHRLQRWLDFARSHGKDATMKSRYESDARRIVTEWGPQGGEMSLTHDYAARLWSGLIRDYYLPRIAAHIEALKAKKSFDFAAWEERWIKASGVSRIKPFKDPVEAAKGLVAEAGRYRQSQANFI
jgi:alpha-N-acetylglucosaminidase